MSTRGGAIAVRAAAFVITVVAGLAGVGERQAHAQIVNVQSRIGEVPEGFSGLVEAGGDYRTGNVSLIIVSAGATVNYRVGAHLVFAVGKAEYGEVGDPAAKFLERTFEHLRYRYTLNPKLTLEAFAQHEYDEFKRLTLRALAGAGPRLTLVNTTNLGVVAGVAYMLEYEELNDTMGAADAGETQTNHRLSSYVIVSAKVNDKVMFSDTTYFQPKLTGFDDFRLLTEAALSIKLTDRLVFTNAFVVAHDSEPPDLLKGTDTALKSTIAFKF